jgi:hypothetical protein
MGILFGRKDKMSRDQYGELYARFGNEVKPFGPNREAY